MFPPRNTAFLLSLCAGFSLLTGRLCAEIVPPLSQGSVNFQSFDYGEGDLSLVGDASILQDDSISLPGNVKRLRLTPGQASKEGTAWLSQKMDLGYGFTTEFSMHRLADGDTGGEGLSFILHNNDTGVGVSCGARGPGAKDLTLAFMDDGGPVLKVRSAGEDLKVVDLAASLAYF